MEKQKLRRFKNQQKQLATEISKKHHGIRFSVNYELNRKKNRMIVVMRFNGICCDEKIIGKVLRRQFTIKYLENGFEVRSSFAPSTVKKF